MDANTLISITSKIEIQKLNGNIKELEHQVGEAVRILVALAKCPTAVVGNGRCNDFNNCTGCWKEYLEEVV